MPDKPMISLQTSENIAPYNQGYAVLTLQPTVGLWSPQLQLAGYLRDCMKTYTGNRVAVMSLTPYRYIGLSVKYKFNTAEMRYSGEGAGEKQRRRMK